MNVSRHKRTRPLTANRVRDFALYILIGLAIVTGGTWYAYQSDGADRGWFGKWVGLAVHTPILFGYTIKEYKQYISRKSFWLVVCALLVVHLAIFTVILLNVEEWKVLWFVFAYPIENMAIDETLAFTGHDRLVRNRRRPPARPHHVGEQLHDDGDTRADDHPDV